MTAIFPSLDVFAKNLRDGKTQLVWTWIPADLETPVSAYLKIAKDKANSFLLESVEGGETLGRYSIIGMEPDLTWTYAIKNGGTENPLEKLRALTAQSSIDIIHPDIPPMGASGLFGFMGYDMVRLVEKIPDNNPDPVGVPDSIMIRPTVMAVFDNVMSRLWIVTPVRETAGDAAALYDAACARVNKVIDALYDPLPSTALHAETSLSLPLDVKPSVEKDEYLSMIAKADDYIRAGDIFQVVLGQDFSMPFDLPGFTLYRSLRRTNPSPFLFYLNFGGFQLVGSSPEILVRVRDGKVTIRPIAGTLPRGATREEDAAFAQKLLNDPKERAEHLMLLDLGRNDVGRVAKTGTVKATEQFIIERYSHVMHIVSNVEGVLRDDLDALDALFAGFPAGTVSGAPKVRAMEIIDELETTRRGYYGGCVGYLSGNGDVDSCIILRTALVKDGKIHVRASAGIVADSVPESEYKECHIKARAIIAAAEDAVERAGNPQSR